MAKKKPVKTVSADVTPTSPSDIVAYGKPVVQELPELAGDAAAATTDDLVDITADGELEAKAVLAYLDFVRRAVATSARLDSACFLVLVPGKGAATAERFDRIDDMVTRLRALYGTDVQAFAFTGRRLAITAPPSYLVDGQTSYPLFAGAGDDSRDEGEGYLGPAAVTDA